MSAHGGSRSDPRLRWRVLLVAALLLLAGCPAGGNDTTPRSPTDGVPTASQSPSGAVVTASPTSTGTTVDRNHSLDEPFVVAGEHRMRYTITGVNRTDRIGGEFGIAADERFVVVAVTVTHVGDNVTRVTNDVFTLVTTENETYAPDSQAMNVAEDALLVRDLAPGASVTGVVIFDTTADSGLRLRVTPINGTAAPHSVALDQRGGRSSLVETGDPGVLADVDRPDDLREL
jgi:hypothetical protein